MLPHNLLGSADDRRDDYSEFDHEPPNTISSQLFFSIPSRIPFFNLNYNNIVFQLLIPIPIESLTCWFSYNFALGFLTITPILSVRFRE